jgi:hypothetical protein
MAATVVAVMVGESLVTCTDKTIKKPASAKRAGFFLGT